METEIYVVKVSGEYTMEQIRESISGDVAVTEVARDTYYKHRIESNIKTLEKFIKYEPEEGVDFNENEELLELVLKESKLQIDYIGKQLKEDLKLLVEHMNYAVDAENAYEFFGNIRIANEKIMRIKQVDDTMPEKLFDDMKLQIQIHQKHVDSAISRFLDKIRSIVLDCNDNVPNQCSATTAKYQLNGLKCFMSEVIGNEKYNALVADIELKIKELEGGKQWHH